MDLQSIKQRFNIIGDDSTLNRALDIATQVANTDLSVLVTGESGVGKEVIPQIIHANSARKHGAYIAVNCGAIPEGTIDSELFGHEKGAFTGANESRKGYFEIASGGTIFLDEVAELPLTTQVRLLRVLQTGEFIKVGSSKVQKTDVRVVAATNINLPQAIEQGKFREDLFYRLNTVPIVVPALREREGDIFLLFRKFASDVAAQYRMPQVSLSAAARKLVENYNWPGNIRQLKNVAEQISVIEESRDIDEHIIAKYLPHSTTSPAIISGEREKSGNSEFNYDREMLFSVLRDMRMEIAELKHLVLELSGRNRQSAASDFGKESEINHFALPVHAALPAARADYDPLYSSVEVVESAVEPSEPMTKERAQREAIISSLKRNGGKRKEAAKELFISERTLYRKMKDLLIEEYEYKK